jgi:predicted Zn-dependent protease
MSPPKYTNPKVPEGISSGHEHPLVDVAKSSAVVVALLAVLVAGSFFAARLAAPYLPFAWEKALAERAAARALDRETGDAAVQAYLQELADRLTAAMDLPEGMTITVHFLEGDTVNAFATLGGHIFIFDGLWQRLDSENTAAMLLGHEIAHVENRDPIRSVSGALLASLAAGALLGDAGIIGNLAGTGSLLTALHFSREQEAQADGDAAAALVALYGHMAGATDLFTTLQSATADRTRPPAFLASHPNLDERIGDLERQAASAGWMVDGEKTPLP